ncbi:cobalamin B12-binding domain-containing protein [Hymenobacter qilianensis]|uniref:Cobalamin B12-binding domain-containing protein n=1 Tax=Hymenobacter qilianensis TaxID=1385715 RepID=A0A7H0GV35_9BACT|nr:cobalamin-dependent protein [Hymenobacter qilianensis]QNP52151.1 cobalamin B12-binding domain-containing protein [Hymenobacter qilianensis]
MANAILMNSAGLFEAHLFHSRHHPADEAHDQMLTQQLTALKQVLAQRLPIAEYIAAAGYLSAAFKELEHPVIVAEPSPPVDSSQEAPLKALADAYLSNLLAGQRAEAISLLRKEAKEGIDVRLIYEHVFMPVQWEVGSRWHRGEITVAQEHYCTAATELAMAMLHPYLQAPAPNGFRFVATTVSSDLHSMPVRMVSDFLEFDGWTPYFLGANTPTDDIWKAVVGFKANLLVLGASMPHHVNILRQLINAKQYTIGASQVSVMVGGAPFNADPTLWRTIGADAYAPNARVAVEAARALVQNK